jgi:hypothetical protein
MSGCAFEAGLRGGGGFLPQLVQHHEHHRRGVEGEDLAEDQAADDGDAQRLAQLGAVAAADGERDRAEERRQGGHQDRPEAQQAGVVDGVAGAFAEAAHALEGDVDHHDGVLLDDADEQDHADHRDQAELGVDGHQRQQRPTPAEGSVDRMVMGWIRLS